MTASTFSVGERPIVVAARADIVDVRATSARRTATHTDVRNQGFELITDYLCRGTVQ